MSQQTTTASLDHLNLTVNQFKQSALWYEKVFGFKIVEAGKMPDGSPWGILQNGDSMLCLYEENRKPAPAEDKDYDQFHRIYHFGLRVQNRSQWVQTIEKEKLKVQYGGAIQYPHSESWYIEDPSGHEIEVVVWKNDQVKFN